MPYHRTDPLPLQRSPLRRQALSSRQRALTRWLERVAPTPVGRLQPAASDASFRRYFRISSGDSSLIVMDAPPEHLDCRPFVAIAEYLREIGLNTPQIFAADFPQGFLLLSDFGSTHYFDVLDSSSAPRLYQNAMAALLQLQLNADPAALNLPSFDFDFLRRELEIFRQWLLQEHLGLQLSPSQQSMLDGAFDTLCRSALEQPQVWMHRDYHSRNLMLTDRTDPGIIDFQDSVQGPLTYDLASLLKDCYVAWPTAQVRQWSLDYRGRLASAGFQPMPDKATFLRWFDLMGAQRHLKAAGLFVRLNIRDGKPGYLAEIPRTLRYVLEVAERHSELAGLGGLLAQHADGLGL